MVAPLVFTQPRHSCGAAGMAYLIPFRPGRVFARPGQPALSVGTVLATRAVDFDSSLTISLQQTMPVRTVLEELFEATGYTVCMGALNFRSVVYLHRLYRPGRTQRFINQEVRFGSHAPRYCTGLGKALLASLSELWRRRLLSKIDFVPRGPRCYIRAIDLLAELATLDYREPVVSDEEYLIGTRSIAVCLRLPHDRQPTAIDVTVPAADFTVQELVEQIGSSVSDPPGTIPTKSRCSTLCPICGKL